MDAAEALKVLNRTRDPVRENEALGVALDALREKVELQGIVLCKNGGSLHRVMDGAEVCYDCFKKPPFTGESAEKKRPTLEEMETLCRDHSSGIRERNRCGCCGHLHMNWHAGEDERADIASAAAETLRLLRERGGKLMRDDRGGYNLQLWVNEADSLLRDLGCSP